ncbi:MAG: tRNA (adenosine(37)-N6)-threonylcarbamoyltransferase complex ATPase subunit type 1 TsaE [Rickettsiales bacterium]
MPSNISELSCFLASEKKTQELAVDIATLCKAGDTILLYGDVGSGKTSFARAFIKEITGLQGNIASPTFNLLSTYPLSDGDAEVWHCDLYRLKNSAEVTELGIEEALENHIVLVEWPELIESMVSPDSLIINLFVDGVGRRVVISTSDVWMDRLKKVEYLEVYNG